MKKICIAVAALLAGISLVGCSNDEPTTRPTEVPTVEPGQTVTVPSSVKICLPDGTPMVALSNLMAEGLTYDGSLVGDGTTETVFEAVPASGIATAFSAYGADLAVMPTVTAAQLYAQGNELVFLSANVFGNLFVVGVGGARSLEDLTGKVVYTTAGTTIALLEYELAANGIAFVLGSEAQEGVVTLYSMAEASMYLPLIKQAQVKGHSIAHSAPRRPRRRGPGGGGEAYGVLGEPAVTKCMTSVATESYIVADMQAEYEALTGEAGYPQACLVASKSFVSAYPYYIETLLTKLEGNDLYAKEHAEELPALFEANGSETLGGMAFTAETVERCNLGLVKGAQAKASVEAYLVNLSEYVEALRDISVEGFFYNAP